MIFCDRVSENRLVVNCKDTQLLDDIEDYIVSFNEVYDE